MEDGSASDIATLARGERLWPDRLASIEIEPARLWARGELEHLQRSHRVAIVGSRAPTAYGLAQARRFGRELAAAGVCVVSGLARGVDSAAHEGALEAGGATVAVLGCGVDRPWPSGPLADAMATRGLLLSEFAPGTRPRKHHFPLRNRIIAALADAVLVVEAAHASGSLITARWAADQGQEVFALPGRVDHPMARGTLRLLREGATAVESPAMLLSDVYGDLPFQEADAARADVDAPAQRALDQLRGETLSAGELAARLGDDVGAVLGQLTTLEMAGAVHRGPGGLYTCR